MSLPARLLKTPGEFLTFRDSIQTAADPGGARWVDPGRRAGGDDAIGTVGTPTTISSGDLDGILMIAVQALEKRTVEQEKEIAELKARLDVLERRVGGHALTAAQ